jgi:hypothetical protein
MLMPSKSFRLDKIMFAPVFPVPSVVKSLAE